MLQAWLMFTAVFNGGGGIFSGIGGTTVTAVVGGFNRAVAPDVVAVSESSVIKGQIDQGVERQRSVRFNVVPVDCFANHNYDYVNLCHADCCNQRCYGEGRENTGNAAHYSCG